MSLATTSTSAPRPLHSLPGPTPWPLLGNAPQVPRGRFHQQLEAWARRYGDIYQLRLGPRRYLVVSAPDVVGSVLRRRPDEFGRSRRMEEITRAYGFLGLFSAGGETWRRQRPMVLGGLDPSHIRDYFPALLDVTARLRTRWERSAGQSLDLQAELTRYTVDVTTGLAFGHDLRTLEQDGGEAIQDHLNVVLPALYARVLQPLDLPAWLRTPAQRRAERALQGHLQALREAVAGFIARTRTDLEREPALRERPRNLIQALVAARDQPGSGVCDEDVAGNVLTMLLAGEDTTANTLAWLVWLLHSHPQALARAREEVDTVLGGAAGVQSAAQLAELPWLDACVQETLRLKPAGPLVMAQSLRETVVGDVLVPSDAIVVCLLRPAALDARTFAQPERFDPQRWVGGAGAVHAMGSAKRQVMAFGAGPRMCPGRYLALAEVKLAAAMLLACFDIEEVGTPGGGEPAEHMAIVMAPVGLRMRLRPRRRPATAGAAGA